jgi:hypothetical protein
LKSAFKNLRRIIIDTGGSQIAEAAFVLPLLFMILLGIMSFGRAFNVYSTITRAAQDGAAVAAQSKSAGLTFNNIQPTNSEIAAAVTSALRASNVAPEQVSTYVLASEPLGCAGLPGAGCSTDGASKIRVCKNVQLNSATSAGPKQCGAIVSFRYPYQFRVPFASINVTSIQMTAVAERQTEN